MSDGKLESAKSCLLAKLSAAKGQKQPEKSIRTYLKKELALDDASLDAVVADLIGRQVLARVAKGKSVSLQLTPTAEEYRKSLPPWPPPPTAEMQRWVLLEMLSAGDKCLLKTEIERLANKPPAKAIGLAKPIVAPLLAALLEQNLATEEIAERSGKASYRLTSQGREMIVRTWAPTAQMRGFILAELFATSDAGLTDAQIDKVLAKPTAKKLGFLKWMTSLMAGALIREKSAEPIAGAAEAAYRLTEAGRRELAQIGLPAEMVFKLTGGAINELLRCAGSSPARVSGIQRPDPGVQPALPTRPAAHLSDDALISEARELLRERHGHTGLVPIFELRRRIIEKFGEQPASHAELDVRLKRLRREYRLRLVSISDRSRATPEQLSESVPGEEEMFFYVGELR